MSGPEVWKLCESWQTLENSSGQIYSVATPSKSGANAANSQTNARPRSTRSCLEDISALQSICEDTVPYFIRALSGWNDASRATGMDDDNTTRVENEYALLEAMYPGEVAYNSKSRELHYSYLGSSLILRLPDSYPGIEAPQIISATSSSKVDLHDKLKDATRIIPIGEEALDTVINTFRELLAETDAESPPPEDDAKHQDKTLAQDTARKQTTIIWLHHLLNNNKRKLALSPSHNDFAGISKPGYPGVLIFSGSASSVQEHVSVLKQQNWAAFQVRYEDDVEWIFEHGAGIKEVESMGEVVRDVGSRKDNFLEAMRMR